jgi:hypothetical protein
MQLDLFSLNQPNMVAHGRDTPLLARIRKPRSPKEMALLSGSALHQQVRHKGLIHLRRYANLLYIFVRQKLLDCHH